MSPDAGTAAHTCANCGATVTDKYCGRCGQRLDHTIHSVWHFGLEATEDLTHADSRLWSTLLALLFKPGFLTQEFLSGRRARYLPPLRLYLVLSVLFFLLITLLHNEGKVVEIKTGKGKTAVELVESKDIGGKGGPPDETPQQRIARVCKPTTYDGPLRQYVVPFVNKSCRAGMQDGGRSIGEAFIHNLPRAMFIFLPALALVMKLMYWRPRHYYVEHLLLFLHNHSFVFLLLSLLMLITYVLPDSLGDWVTVAAWLYVPYYLFTAMKRVYGQSGLMTFAKLGVLSFAYFVGALITLAATAAYSIYSL